MVGFFHCLSLGERLEHSCRIHTDLLIGCHQRQIRIESCRLFIVVSGSDLCDIFDPVFSFLCDKAKLGMYFESFEAVNNLTTCLLQHT